MSKKFQCKRFGKRARYRTPSRFRQKAYRRLSQLKSHIKMASILVFLAAAICFLWTSQAQAKSRHFEKWLVDIQINQDSTFLVRETQTVKFEGSFTWLKRDIAKKDLRQIKDIKVFDEAGVQLTGESVEISQSSKQASIKLNFSATDTTKTWAFEYLVSGGLRFFKDHDELYWNAVSSERDVPINQVDVLVHLPQEINLNQAKQRLLIGPERSQNESADFAMPDQRTFHFWGADIKPYEHFTVVAGWPKSIVKQAFWEKFLPWVSWLWLLLPICVFVFLFRRWQHYGRDPKLKGTIVAQYEPQDNLSPAEVAAVVYQAVKQKDISASIVDLACRGYLRILEKKKRVLFTEKTVYEFEKQKEYVGDDQLKDHESLLLNVLFQGRSRVTTEDLTHKFYKDADAIRKVIWQQVVNFGLGYFKDNPESVQKRYAGIGIGVFLVGVSNIFKPFFGGVPLSLALLLSGIVIAVLGVYMPALTPKGAQAKWQALGFKEYLRVAERFRLQDLTPQTFEKFLPYAMVFSVEKEWAARFEDIYRQPPNWYVPAVAYYHFSAMNFTDQVSSMNTNFSRSLFAAPGGGHGGSGFGGGGFAGGGGGGGGSSAG